MIELRWIFPNEPTTLGPVLQYREYHLPSHSGVRFGGGWTDWASVPAAIVDVEEYKVAILQRQVTDDS